MNPSPVYVLLGEEDFLKQNALLKIKANCTTPENESVSAFNYISIDGKTTGSSRLLTECEQLPFMNNIRLVVVKDAEKIIDDAVLEYIKNPSKTTCLVLMFRKIDKRLSIYKVLEKYADVQEFDHPDEKDTTAWIQHYIKTGRKNISATDASRLANILDNNLTGIQQELEKLIAYSGKNDTITYNDIETIVSENRLNDSFALTESIQNKDTSTAIKLVNKLLNQGNAVPQIIGTIRWMLTRLWMGKELLEKGDRHSVSKELRIPSYFLGKFINQVEKFDIAELKMGLVKVLELEKLMRTYTLPQNLVLELLVIKLGTAKHQPELRGHNT